MVVVGGLGFAGDFLLLFLFGQFQKKRWLSADPVEGRVGPNQSGTVSRFPLITSGENRLFPARMRAEKRDDGCSEHSVPLCGHLEDTEFKEKLGGVESNC